MTPKMMAKLQNILSLLCFFTNKIILEALNQSIVSYSRFSNVV